MSLSGSDHSIDFRSECGRRVEDLLQARGMPFRRREIQGEEESYLLFDRLGVPVTIYVYEAEAGYFLNEEWSICEAPDFDGPEELARAFVARLGEAIAAARRE